MRSDSSERIDLFILTGFLGSGKTTALNAMLRDPAFAETAVIVNEFGEIGLDHLLVEAASGDVVLLDSGCLCCAAGDSLEDTLVDLWVRRERGEIPRFQRIVIETSGLADPVPIVATVMKSSLLAPRYRHVATITTIDCVYGAETLVGHCEAQTQAKLADKILLTKGDLLEAQPARTRAAVVQYAPFAEISYATKASLDASRLLERGNAPRPSAEYADTAPDHAPNANHHDHHHAARHGTRAIQRSLALATPISWQMLSEFLAELKNSEEPLLRCKCLFAIHGEPHPVALHGVRKLFETEILNRMQRTDDQSRLVFIFDAPPKNFDQLIAPLLPAATRGGSGTGQEGNHHAF